MLPMRIIHVSLFNRVDCVLGCGLGTNFFTVVSIRDTLNTMILLRHFDLVGSIMLSVPLGVSGGSCVSP